MPSYSSRAMLANANDLGDKFRFLCNVIENVKCLRDSRSAVESSKKVWGTSGNCEEEKSTLENMKLRSSSYFLFLLCKQFWMGKEEAPGDDDEDEFPRSTTDSKYDLIYYIAQKIKGHTGLRAIHVLLNAKTRTIKKRN
ncbi:hypothetical protein CHUAL_009799 [Chamberlinius hualienensis]